MRMGTVQVIINRMGLFACTLPPLGCPPPHRRNAGEGAYVCGSSRPDVWGECHASVWSVHRCVATACVDFWLFGLSDCLNTVSASFLPLSVWNTVSTCPPHRPSTTAHHIQHHHVFPFSRRLGATVLLPEVMAPAVGRSGLALPLPAHRPKTREGLLKDSLQAVME
jgi:hypothetical protein